MVTLKYRKEGACAYFSHIDVLRHLTRTFRRADIDVRFSAGFNPHILINLGVPLPLGLQSAAEYVTINTDMEAAEVLKRYNEVCLAGLSGTAAYNVKSNPNLAGITVYADYSIGCHAKSAEASMRSILNEEKFLIKYPTKKDPQGERDLKEHLIGLKVYDDAVNVCLSAGNTTLRADILAEALSEMFGFKYNKGGIWRINQYVRGGGKLLNTDDFLSSLK
jgi:radical SAM-linked protein